MTGTRSRAAVWIAASCLAASAAACSQDELSGAKAEVQETNISLDLPEVPAFDMPSPNPDGTHPPREMRLKGNEFLDTEVQVKGHVVWDYDCAQAIRTPDMTDKDVERLLRKEPERCERPNLYLGDTAEAKPEKGVWVVEVPRPPRPDERRNLPRSQLAAEKHICLGDECPDYQVGDHVIITGTWALRSPHGATKSEGLLVYSSLEHVGGAGE